MGKVPRLPSPFPPLRRRSKQNEVCVIPAHIERLPVEIWQYIASYLPIVSAASLALCNRYLFKVLGTRYWHELSTKPALKVEFLSNFEKDLPNHWICYNCAVFHRRHPDQESRWDFFIRDFKQLYDPPCVTKNWVHVGWADIGIKQYQVQLAMNRHRYGLSHGIPVESFYHPWSTKSEQQSLDKSYFMRARIVNDEFILCYRRRFRLRKNSGRYPIDFIQDRFGDVPLLPNWPSSIDTVSFDRLLHYVYPNTRSGFEGCRNSATEFHVEILDEAGSPFRDVIVSVWKNLGSGKAPPDSTWEAHSSGVGATNFVRGSIRAAFESKEGLGFWERISWRREYEAIRKSISRNSHRLARWGARYDI